MFGDGMKMGEGLSLAMGCGHPHVEQYFSRDFLPDCIVDCPLCGQKVHGALRELPDKEMQA